MKVATNLSAVFATIIFSTTMLRAADQLSGDKSSTDANWSELVTSMEKMHMAMGKMKQSGDNDVDFVRLMLPHHEAAIDMAKTELLYGKDPQMRRLAQEIITDQQLEIDLMHRWLKLRDAN